MSEKSIHLGSWAEIGITLPLGRDESYHTCPNCSADRKPEHQKLKVLCINTVKFENQIGHCNHCKIVYYVRPEGTKTTKPTEKIYTQPPPRPETDLPPEIVKWFEEKRNIRRETLIDLNIKAGMEYMPQKQAEVSTIQFPYYIENELINVKYRSSDKNFKMHSGAKLVFYNLNSIKDETECTICEGEIDALSFHEIGIKNVISVPNGANLSQKERGYFERTGEFDENNITNMQYMDNSWQYLNNIKKFYIATDTDPPGLKLREELIRRLGPHKCVIVDFGEYKDANEVLCSKNGRLELEECLERATNPPIASVYTINDDRSQLIEEYHTGYKRGLSLGIPALEKYYSLKTNELDLINGIPGSGKTYFMIWVSLIASVMHNWRWAVYLPEHMRTVFWRRIIEMYIGKNADMKSTKRMTKREYIHAIEFLNEYFYFIDPTEFVTPDYILDKSQELVLTKGVNGLVAGPWNSMYHKKEYGERDDDYLQRRLSQFRIFNKNFNVKTILETHPQVIRDFEEKYVSEKERERLQPAWTNMNKGTIASKYKRKKVPDAYDISGGAMWRNRVDNIITPYVSKIYPGVGFTEIHIHKIKEQQIVGVTTDDPRILKFKLSNGRYYGLDNHCPLPVIDMPDQTAMDIQQA